MHTVITDTTARNWATNTDQPVRWTYDTAQPAMVTMTTPSCPQGCCWTTWEMSRHLIAEAWLRCSGEGDVHACVHEDGYLYLHLTSPAGRGLLTFNGVHLWNWMLDTFEVMPPCRNRGCCTTGTCRECDALAATTERGLVALLTAEGM